MTLSLYHPGASPLHRLTAGAKLAGLAAAAVAIAVIDHSAPLAALAALAFLALWSTGAPGPQLRRQVMGVAIIAGLVFVANAVLTSPAEGLRFALRIAALVWLAAAVTITTRTDAILELIEGGLDRFGARGRRLADRLGLAVALVIRFVPELFAHAGALRDACRARDLRPSALHLLVPMLIRTLKTADDVTDALEARGYPREP